MAAFIFSDLKQRYLDLVGQPNGTIDAFGSRNINYAIHDICNKYQFSWNKKTDTATIASGTANLPSDLNPRWQLEDVRDASNNIYTQVPIWDKDNYSEGDYVYWVLPSSDPDVFTINSPTDGLVNVTYYWKPTSLSAAADKCIVPDIEAVSYLAASKRWVGAERDTQLKADYEAEANKLIDAMYLRDLQSAEPLVIHSVAFYNDLR
jgi:hypothetical protein